MNLSPLSTHPSGLSALRSKVVVQLLFIHSLLLLPLFEGNVLVLGDDARIS